MNIAHPHAIVAPPWPPPQNWRGTWPPPGAQNGGVPVVGRSSYPAPPPMPPGFAYGKRAWMNGSWMMVPDNRPRSRIPGKDSDYWKTELKANPLGLENMIPAEQLRAQASGSSADDPTHQNGSEDAKSVVWVPALTDDDPRGRIFQRQVSSSSRSSSQPPNRERTDSSPPPPLPIPSLNTADNFNTHGRTMMRPQSSMAHRPVAHRPAPSSMSRYDRHANGRMSVPADSARHNNNFRHASEPPPMSAPAQQSSYHYPHQRHAIDSDSDTTATATQRPQSRGMAATRSYTLPPENMHRDRYPPPHQRYASPVNSGAQVRRRGSIGGSMPVASTSIQRSQTMPAELRYPMPSRPHGTGAQAGVRVQGSREHLQDAPYSSRDIYAPNNYRQQQQQQEAHALYGAPPRMPTPESVDDGGDEEPIDPKSVDRVRKWLAKNEDINRQKPVIRRTVDSYDSPVDRTRGGNTPGMAIRQLGRGEELTRASTMPVIIPEASPRPYFQNYSGPMMNETDGLTRQLSSMTTEEDEYVGPMSSGRHNGLQRSDTLIIDVDAENRDALLPSPRSLPIATHAASNVAPRRSLERVLGHPASGLHPSPKSFTSNRSGTRSHHVSPASSQHFHNASIDANRQQYYSSPPITPNRINPLYQQKEQSSSAQKGLYNMPTKAGSRSNITNSTVNSPALTPHRHEGVHHHHQRSSSVQPSPSSYQVPRQLQYVYQHENGSSTSFHQQSPTLRHNMQQQQTQHRQAASYSQPLQHQQDDDYVGPGQLSHRSSGRQYSQSPSRSPSPTPGVKIIPSPHHQHASIRQSPYQSTPPRPIVPGTSSPAYARGGHGQVRHTSPASGSEKRARNVRMGYWNRRGDHITSNGFIVYCPPGRNFPADLADYPENAFQDHHGQILRARPEAYTEHPESIPQGPRREPMKPYDMFIEYVLVDN